MPRKVHTHRVIAVATGLVLAAALLAGCGGEPIEAGTGGNKPGASGKPKTPASAPLSTAPSNNRGLPGEEAKAVTAAAGEWIKASNQASKTLDPAPLLALSDPACDNCNAIAKQFRAMKAAGGRFTGDYQQLTQGVKTPQVKGDTAKVVLVIRKGAWKLSKKSGAKAESFKPQIFEIHFDLKKVNGKWVVTSEVPYTRK